ncbi:hypothetical protein HQ544_00885 [Candidatus Falkowbacteria bacterium]|nr:hypothetical protein [Candidatus Falkowbacteria bacterium]
MKKRTLIFIIVLLLVFGVGVVGSRAVMDYSRKAERYYNYMCNRTKIGLTHAMICDLSHRIDAIPEGPQGPPGPAGPSLKVVDAEGTEVGYLLEGRAGASGFGYSHVRVFSPDFNLILTLYLHNGTISLDSLATQYPADELYYENPQCLGEPHVIHMTNPYFLGIRGPHDNRHWYRADGYEDVRENVHFTGQQYNDGTCRVIDQTYEYSAKVYEIPEPSFVGPLRIIED